MSAAFEWSRPDDVRHSPTRSGRARLEIPVLVEAEGAMSAGITRNLSQEGAFVATPRPPSVGERLTLRLAVPGHEVPLAISALVRWLRPIDDAAGQPAGIGVSFVDPPFGVSLCIAWLLHSHEER
jgi:Tfp pilus assembly protein PilZ